MYRNHVKNRRNHSKEWRRKSKNRIKEKNVQEISKSDEESVYITKGRLTKQQGIFLNGKGSSFRQRDLREETRARAEENLSKIIKLSSNKRFNGEVFNDYGQCSHQYQEEDIVCCHPDLRKNTKDVKKQKRCVHEHFVDQEEHLLNGARELHKKLKKEKKQYKEDKNRSSIAEKKCSSEQNSTKSSTNENSCISEQDNVIDVKENVIKQNWPLQDDKDVPYEDFAHKIKSCLKSATALLSNGKDSYADFEFSLQRVSKDCHVKLTPPSSGQSISSKLLEFEMQDKEFIKEQMSISPTPTANRTEGLEQTLMIVSPKQVIQRYKRKLSIDSPEGTQIFPRKPFSSDNRKESNFLEQHPVQTRKNKNNSVTLNPLKFLQNYEANVKEPEVTPTNQLYDRLSEPAPTNITEEYRSHDRQNWPPFNIVYSSSHSSSGHSSISPEFLSGAPSSSYQTNYHSVSDQFPGWSQNCNPQHHSLPRLNYNNSGYVPYSELVRDQLLCKNNLSSNQIQFPFQEDSPIIISRPRIKPLLDYSCLNQESSNRHTKNYNSHHQYSSNPGSFSGIYFRNNSMGINTASSTAHNNQTLNPNSSWSSGVNNQPPSPTTPYHHYITNSLMAQREHPLFQTDLNHAASRTLSSDSSGFSSLF